MNIKGTKTEANIKEAFAGESMARNRYNYWADQARQTSHDLEADLFDKMAANEKEHAKIWFKLLNNGLGDTEINLLSAAHGEHFEWKNMYPEFAKVARDEGLDSIAQMFERVAAIEKDHEARFLKEYNAHTKPNATQSSEQPEMKYRCMFCGALANDYLDVCYVCEAIGAFEPNE